MGTAHQRSPRRRLLQPQHPGAINESIQRTRHIRSRRRGRWNKRHGRRPDWRQGRRTGCMRHSTYLGINRACRLTKGIQGFAMNALMGNKQSGSGGHGGGGSGNLVGQLAGSFLGGGKQHGGSSGGHSGGGGGAGNLVGQLASGLLGGGKQHGSSSGGQQHGGSSSGGGLGGMLGSVLGGGGSVQCPLRHTT